MVEYFVHENRAADNRQQVMVAMVAMATMMMTAVVVMARGPRVMDRMSLMVAMIVVMLDPGSVSAVMAHAVIAITASAMIATAIVRLTVIPARSTLVAVVIGQRGICGQRQYDNSSKQLQRGVH